MNFREVKFRWAFLHQLFTISIISLFVTLTAWADSVTTQQADATVSDAILNASFTISSPGSVWFNWGSDTIYGNSSSSIAVVPGGSTNIDRIITGLQGYTTYHFQAVLSNDNGVVYGADQSFSTSPRLTLTPSPNTSGWISLLYSTDGSTIAGSDSQGVYVSRDGANSWHKTLGIGRLSAISTNGSKMFALPATGICSSSDYGVTWATNSTPTGFTDLAESTDWQNFYALTGGGVIYKSTNSGATWTQAITYSVPWRTIACSADGRIVIATATAGGSQDPGYIYMSTNFGSTWGQRWSFSQGPGWQTTFCSADATYIGCPGYAALGSRDSGVTWNFIYPVVGGSGACSANGMFVVVGNEPYVCFSRDNGNTWVQRRYFDGYLPHFTCSADGEKIAAAGQYFYLSQSSTTPKLGISLSTNNLKLSWSVASTSFVVQQSSSIVDGNWGDLITPTLDNGSSHTCTIPIPSDQMYFRLVLR